MDGVGALSESHLVPCMIHCAGPLFEGGVGAAEVVRKVLEEKVIGGRGPCLCWERKSGN